MKFTNFDEFSFRTSVNRALEKVKCVLDTTRNPRLAEDEEHKYEDKYAMAEFMTNSSNKSVLEILERLGLDSEKKATISSWVQDKKPVMLRFEASDGCSFLKEQEVEVKASPEIQEVTTTTTGSGDDSSNTTKEKKTTVVTVVTRKVTEYHWKVHISYKLTLFAGGEQNVRNLILQSRNSSMVVVTVGGNSRGVSSSARPVAPIADKTIHPHIDLDMTWLFSNLCSLGQHTSQFSIDRNNADTCKTPRRNNEVEQALRFYERLYNWAARVGHDFFVLRLEVAIVRKHRPVKHQQGETEDRIETPNNTQHLFQIQSDDIFIPVLPLLENGSALTAKDGTTGSDLFKAHKRSMDEAMNNLTEIYPSDDVTSSGGRKRSLDEAMEDSANEDDYMEEQTRKGAKLISTSEASIVLMLKCLMSLKERYAACVNYIESMLKKQLVQAIGKEVDSHAFEQFMRFNYQKLFGSEYAPKPFTYAVRRPNHYPDGILSIEGIGGEKIEPVDTLKRYVPGGSQPPMYIPLNAATSVEITGDRFLHGWIQHRFEENTGNNKYQLAARARQFSNFMILIGTVAGPDKFEPKDAIILQNKDEVLIPLLTEVLPTAKEFKDAIASLSPEQQSFARAFRRMQLESSVFGVCIIQLKPQLEKLLGLPPGSLTKEISMTQNLMSLFVDYQIPSDLLSFDGPAENVDTPTKLAAVKAHIQAVMDVIKDAKEKQLAEEAQKASMYEAMRVDVYSDRDRDRDRDWCEEGVNVFGSSPASFGRSGALPGFSRPFSFKCSESAAPPPPPTASGTSAPIAACARAGGVPRYCGGSKRFRKADVASSSVDDVSPMHSSLAVGHNPTQSTPAEDWTHVDDSISLEGGDDFSQIDKEDEDDLNEAQSSFQREVEDFTQIPKLLDAKLEKFDTDKALRSTVIKAGRSWTRKRQKNLLTPSEDSILQSSSIDDEKKKAFDLLDAISRSGTLPIDCAELHVVIAVSHCFENDIMGTIIQDNSNPIDKVEKSALMIASTIYGKPTKSLVHDQRQLEELTANFPRLFASDERRQKN